MRSAALLALAFGSAPVALAGKDPELVIRTDVLPGFTIMFVKADKTTSKIETVAVPGSATRLQVEVNQGVVSKDVTIMVTRTTYPTAPADAKAFFDAVRDGAAGTTGKVTDEKDVKLAETEIPGREVTLDQGTYRTKFRTFLDGKTMYQVLITGPKADVTAGWSKKYLVSFAPDK